jgi:hypothetical protein
MCCFWTNPPMTWTPKTLASLENAIAEFPGCVMVTAHDRWFLDRVATRHPRVGRHRNRFRAVTFLWCPACDAANIRCRSRRSQGFPLLFRSI